MNEIAWIRDLKKLLGPEKVFSGSEYLLAYSYDATGLQFPPDAVVMARDENDISATLKIANEYDIPVTPRGAGVGYSGGALPVKRGIVLAFTRMNRICSLDRDAMIAEVEPGVVTHSLQQEAEKMGLFYPPDPASLKSSTIGGNVAENAGGMRCFKYGVTGDYVLKLHAFLADGRKIKTGSLVIKDVAGYDLTSLLVGSEGTLAVVSRIWLRLLSLPQKRILVKADFSSLENAARLTQKLVHSGIAPSVLEFMDRTSINAVNHYLGRPGEPGVEASLLIELDGNPQDTEERHRQLLSLLSEARPLSFLSAHTTQEQDSLWEMRRNISQAISRLKPKKINEDIVVPILAIPETVSFMKKLAADSCLIIVLFGHFGDGNIHTNLLVDPEDQDEMKRAAEALEKIFKFVAENGGSITGEHGVGITKQPYLHYQLSETEIALHRQIKQAFDPKNLLNPGKIFQHA